MADLKKIGDILVLIGALIGLLEGILTILGASVVNVLGDLLGALGGLVMGIIAILFALIALVNSGFLKIKALDFGKTNKFLIVLIVGVLMIVFASTIGGLLVVIGAILWIVK
ncbi:MAG: hypothetical protein ACTSUO_02065 [Candidatus Thorarchaeota archaeon]